MEEGVSTTAIPSAGQAAASAAIASLPLSGSACGGSPGSGRGSGGGRSDCPTSATSSTSSTSSTSARVTSPRMASPMGDLAASPGSLVMATSEEPSASSGPGLYG